jgi:hypothetical protein
MAIQPHCFAAQLKLTCEEPDLSRETGAGKLEQESALFWPGSRLISPAGSFLAKTHLD